MQNQIIRSKRLRIAGLTCVAWTAVAVAGSAQTFGNSAFDVGGALLLEPAPADTLTPGTIPTAGGTADQTEVVGPDGRPARGNEGTGPLLTIDLSTGFFYEDNDDAPNESYFGTRLTFGAFTETRSQQFSIDVGALARIDDNNRTDFITEPAANLSYALFNRGTRLDVDLGLREADVDDGFLPANFDADDLALDDGTEETTTARVTLVTGADRRFGTRTSLGFRQREFTDTTNPDLVDQVRLDASTELRFTVDRRVELTVFADIAERTDDDAIDTVETNYSAGLRGELLLDRAWTASFEVASVVEEIETTAGITREDGVDVSATLTRFMPNGTLAFDASYSAIDGVAALATRRALTLANGATVSAQLGIFNFDQGGVEPNLGLTYTHEILRGRVVTLNLTQSGSESDDDETLLRTVLNASYRHELTRNGTLSLNAGLADVAVQEGASADTLATTFGVAYRHDLTEDWSLVARADTQVTFEDDVQTDRENTFSINLERTFSFRP